MSTEHLIQLGHLSECPCRAPRVCPPGLEPPFSWGPTHPRARRVGRLQPPEVPGRERERGLGRGRDPARVRGCETLRWALVWATAGATILGYGATQLPEWAELLIGVPFILGVYGWLIWTRGFGPADRELFRKHPEPAAASAS